MKSKNLMRKDVMEELRKLVESPAVQNLHPWLIHSYPANKTIQIGESLFDGDSESYSFLYLASEGLKERTGSYGKDSNEWEEEDITLTEIENMIIKYSITIETLQKIKERIEELSNPSYILF